MSEGVTQLDWLERNQVALTAHLDRIRTRLEMAIGIEPTEATGPIAAGTLCAIDPLCAVFGLSDFERDLLLLCAGVELDSRIAGLCARLGGDKGRSLVNFQLAFSVLQGAHWTAILPISPLRRWFLLEMDLARSGSTLSGSTLIEAGLRISERVLHHLTGIEYQDDSLRAVLRECDAPAALLPSHEAIAARLTSRLLEPRAKVVMLTGADERSRRDVAAAACASLGARLYSIDITDTRNDPGERDVLARLWEREAKLTPCVLQIECDPATQGPAWSLAETLLTDVILSSHDLRSRAAGSRKQIVRIDLPEIQSGERRDWWVQRLGARAVELNGSVEALSAQFDLAPVDIDAAISSVVDTEPESLWDACRVQARVAIDELAHRIEPSATWSDLILPVAQAATLRQINAHMRQRLKVYEHWGFGPPGTRGLGMSALFAGPSGTGKTMAAEVLATELKLDLFRIDLSQVVSKYVGETEKNLRRVFEAAEHGGAILLFDEADALFGKRSEVKDSHDRYANIEISYLLQQMEAYRGLAILTTNQRSALDTAFLRRLRFIVDFPFPDAAMRAEIWSRVFPESTPRQDLNPGRLSRLSVPGGNIRNIALNAAFLAADEDEAVNMSHILRAARSEYAKLEKPLTEAETSDWLVE
ncbi:MAG: ATP-binding protein [Acidobacteriota bacterium]